MINPIRPLVIALTLLASLAAVPASAQAPATPDEWQKDVTIYLFGASLDGTVGALGRTAVVEQSFSDILGNLEFGAMGAFRMSKGRWQVSTDFAYTGLGVTAQTPPADINIKTSWLDITAGYAVKPGVSLLFGGRLNRMKNEVAFKDATRVKVDASKTWLDPEVGVALAKPISDKFVADSAATSADLASAAISRGSWFRHSRGRRRRRPRCCSRTA